MDIQDWWDLSVKVGSIGAFMLGIFVFALWRRWILLAYYHDQLIEQYQLRLTESESRRKQEKAEWTRANTILQTENTRLGATTMAALRAGREWYDEKAKAVNSGSG